MNVLITESQKRVIITEGMQDTLTTLFEHGIDFSANLYKRISKKFNFNLKILLTFGATVGGLLQPLEQFLEGKYPDLSEDQKLLILTACVCVVFNEGKEILKKIIPEIKKQDIENEFQIGLSKTRKLVTAFKGFLGTLGNSAAFISDVMSYVYMIPLLGYLTMAIQGHSFTEGDVVSLAKRLGAIGIFHISTAVLEEIVQKILKK